jgi:hypothetical protein
MTVVQYVVVTGGKTNRAAAVELQRDRRRSRCRCRARGDARRTTSAAATTTGAGPGSRRSLGRRGSGGGGGGSSRAATNPGEQAALVLTTRLVGTDFENGADRDATHTDSAGHFVLGESGFLHRLDTCGRLGQRVTRSRHRHSGCRYSANVSIISRIEKANTPFSRHPIFTVQAPRPLRTMYPSRL